MMNKDELITKQQLELEHYKAQSITNSKIRSEIIGKCYNMGQPLNDNILQFNPEQQKWVWDVVKLAEDFDFTEPTGKE